MLGLADLDPQGCHYRSQLIDHLPRLLSKVGTGKPSFLFPAAQLLSKLVENIVMFPKRNETLMTQLDAAMHAKLYEFNPQHTDSM